MDPEKAAFLDDAGDDPELDGSDGVALQVAFRDAIGQQIVDDYPPQVWRTAQRLLGGGMAAPAVWRQLVLAFGASVVAAADADAARFDRDGYLSSLDRLPLPSAERVIEVLVAAVRDRQPVSADEVDELVAAELGLPLDDPLTETLLDLVQDELLDEHEGPLAMLAPDLLVHVPSLVDGVVLTHRLTDGERESGTLLAADLPGFARIELRHEDDAVFEAVAEDCRSRWIGPPDWLQPYPAGALLAVRVAPDGQVALTVLDEEPELADELVAEVRAAYDAEVDEAWLPVTGEDLVLGVLARDRGAFTRPAPPLSELAAAAGLQEREERYAHEESVWRLAERIDRARRMSDLLGPGPAALSALRVLDFLDGEPPDTADAREILHALADPQVFDVVLDELLGVGDLERPSGFDALIPTLIKAASRGNERAVAELLAAVACERDGAVLDAESHLREAVRADPGWPPAEDRLAWYVVPDGESHQLIGGLFRVPPGTEGPLLELLDRRDGFGLLSFVAAQSRPRTFVTTEGEPLLDCRAQSGRQRRTAPDGARCRGAAGRRTGRRGDAGGADAACRPPRAAVVRGTRAGAWRPDTAPGRSGSHSARRAGPAHRHLPGDRSGQRDGRAAAARAARP